MLTAQTWPIAANMLSFGSLAPDGTPLIEAPAAVWRSQLQQVVDLDFEYVDPTDATAATDRTGPAAPGPTRLTKATDVPDHVLSVTLRSDAPDALGVTLTATSTASALACLLRG